MWFPSLSAPSHAVLRVSGVGGSGGRPRGGRSGRIVPPAQPQLRSALPSARLGPGLPGGPESLHQLPAGSRLPGGTSGCPGKGSGRQTDRATSPFSLRPNSSRAHTKEGEETRELRGWLSGCGLDSSCDGGWRRRLRTAGRGEHWPGEPDPEVPERPRGGAGRAWRPCAALLQGFEGAPSGAWGEGGGSRRPRPD